MVKSTLSILIRLLIAFSGGLYMKNNNAITINVNDNLRALIDKLAAHHNRRPAELLRILLTPVLIDEYAKTQREKHAQNTLPLTPAIFNE